ncbi:MAG: hypothetical protein EA383_16435 [Spirochaetaceae bacterium]|nr:MAG: hypothetical protein EA383_16435 [Spirochaetaceae bacterium]
MDALKRYSRPRDKVTQLIKTGIVTRIKKGMYVDGRKDLRALPVREAAANLIYGPSYVSLQFALSSHGLIPEAAIQVTSVTFKKTKQYRTPLGDFIYRSVPEKYYPYGVIRRAEAPGVPYLIACPEKAVMDMLYFAIDLRSMRDVQSYLLDDLRLDEHSLRDLDPAIISEIAEAAGTPKLLLCGRALRRIIK